MIQLFGLSQYSCNRLLTPEQEDTPELHAGKTPGKLARLAMLAMEAYSDHHSNSIASVEKGFHFQSEAASLDSS